MKSQKALTYTSSTDCSGTNESNLNAGIKPNKVSNADQDNIQDSKIDKKQICKAIRINVDKDPAGNIIKEKVQINEFAPPQDDLAATFKKEKKVNQGEHRACIIL